tara:strand:- start:583 stop:774 length:192 start_codon:yes stop_codon:yes gene_type:complete
MQFAKAQQECQSFLDSFIAGLSLRGIANLFGGTCFYFLNIKAWGNKPCPYKNRSKAACKWHGF